jgi:hypothetical protein
MFNIMRKHNKNGDTWHKGLPFLRSTTDNNKNMGQMELLSMTKVQLSIAPCHF